MLSRLRAAIARVRELFRPRSRYRAELDEEFAFHLDMETAENLRRGMNEHDARRAALLSFGGAARFREETNETRGVVGVDHLVRDTLFALRRLRRAPAFATSVIATLGIGIGAAVGIGSIVHGVLLRELPYDEPERLVRVGFHVEDGEQQGDLHPAATYFHFATAARSFTELGAYYTSDAFNITDGEAPERVSAAVMTPNTFTLLGARPLLGQLFERGDSSWSNPRNAMLISEELWRRRYGADSSIVGRRIELNRGARVVIGVLPRSFRFPAPSVDVFYPAPIPVARPGLDARGYHVIGRLRDDVEPSAAEAELRTLLPALSQRFPAVTPDMLQRARPRVTVKSLKSATVADVRPQLVLLGALVAVVLLVATANTLNLFLLRAQSASREIAVVLSLGASRLAVAQRFVMEGVVLGLASAVVALPAAAAVLSSKFGFTQLEIPRLQELAFTRWTAVLVIVGGLLIGGGVGLVGLTRTGTDGLFDRLRAAGATSGRAWARARNGLVALQVAIALVLLVAGGLLGRSFRNLHGEPLNFEPAGAMAFQVSLPWDGYTTYAANAAFHAGMVDRLAAVPGVAAVGVASHLPLASSGSPELDMQLEPAGQAGAAVATASNMASGDYFRAMGIPIRAGRSFRAGDLRGTPAVVVSERLAASLFGTTDVVGRTIRRPAREGASPRSFRIVGVAGDVHWGRIEDGYVPMVYFPLLRDGDGLPADSAAVPGKPREVEYVVRGTALPGAPEIHDMVTALDRRVPPTRIRTLEAVVDGATARVRLTLLLIAAAGAAALLLGVIGVYSVVTYAAGTRKREFGIRLALGAPPSRIARMVLGDGLRLVLVGIAAGLVAAAGATRFLRGMLYRVEPTSIAEFAIATAALVVITVWATLLPARRAARTPPEVVLRGE